MPRHSISNLELWSVYKNYSHLNDDEKKLTLFLFLKNKFVIGNNEQASSQLKIKLRKSFFNNLYQRLKVKNSQRITLANFDIVFKSWLSKNFIFCYEDQDTLVNNKENQVQGLYIT